ncbi:hypothetical protein SDC9_133109 [bioreactor metagenome]|uniref:Glycerophosphoryl diester phosphodiesterase membrane domain-containing protein n=1 Tax=bioreactor metagenome TaxID=1076179 RepID=A0A645D9D8_9ZZZZ
MIKTRLSILDSMKSGFLLWKENFTKIIVVGVIVYLPTQICIELVRILLDKSLLIYDTPTNLSIANNIYTIIRILIGSIALLAILNFIINKLENEDIRELTIKEILSIGLKRWEKFIGVGIIAGFKIIGYTLLLIIPGIYKAVRLSFIDCVVATNNNKFKDECDESEKLVKNQWWSVFGFLLLMFLLKLLLEFLFMIPLYYISSQLVTILIGTVVSLLETYFIVVRACYYYKINRLTNETLSSEEILAKRVLPETPLPNTR